MNHLPPFIWVLVDRLRRRGLSIGVDDCAALRSALAAGFGLGSDDALRTVCVSLWAKSADEVVLISTVFAGLGDDLPRWSVEDDARAGDDREQDEDGGPGPEERAAPRRPKSPRARPRPDALRATELDAGISPPPDLGGTDVGLLLQPRFPLPARDIAQVWRRLSRPGRGGPPIEVDAAATLDLLARSGVATPPVMLPRRANRSTLLMLLDRDGSMSPYHGYVDHIVRAITQLGRLSSVTVRYFHDVPGQSPDRAVLAGRPNRLTRQLDAVLGAIRPLTSLRLYRDTPLSRPDPLRPSDLLRFSSTVVVSDAGAARGRYDGDRLVDTVAFGRVLRQLTNGTVAWLNPVEPRRWAGSTAEQIARHLPMFPMTRDGMTLAVEALRGRPPVLEHPL